LICAPHARAIASWRSLSLHAKSVRAPPSPSHMPASRLPCWKSDSKLLGNDTANKILLNTAPEPVWNFESHKIQRSSCMRMKKESQAPNPLSKPERKMPVKSTPDLTAWSSQLTLTAGLFFFLLAAEPCYPYEARGQGSSKRAPPC
jgi:hypothetical protein